MKYRPEIDGLRALAVVPVILFHAGVELFGGGFVGVDMFFVISGYLITTILIEDLSNNRFSILNFYERRARRILPALFFVMLACIPFAWMWMSTTQMKDFSQSLIAVSLFSSNFLFWSESGYFDTATEEKPLLHTWSLAVEEQYYIFFPIFLFLAWRSGKDKVFWMIVVLSAMSLALSEWGWRNNATANFYLLPARAWELFAGSIAAFIVQKHGVRPNNWLASVGLLALLVAIFVFDETTPFPSVYALVPVLGAVLIILFAGKETVVAKLLSKKLLVGIGLISYSVYLWHQPLFAFNRLADIAPLEWRDYLRMTLATFLLAYITWRFVEQPFRNKTRFGQQLILKGSVFFVGSFIVLGSLLFWTNGAEKFRLSDEDRSVLATAMPSPKDIECHFPEDEKSLKREACRYFEDDVSVAVFGNSHAIELSYAVAEALQEYGLGVVQHTISSCIHNYAVQTELDTVCQRWHAKVVEELVADTRIESVVLSFRNDLHLHNPVYRNSLIDILSALVEANKNVILVLQAPLPGAHIQKIYQANMDRLKSPIKGLTRQSWEATYAAVGKLLNNMPQEVQVINPADLFCEAEYCFVSKEGIAFYHDDDHMSVYGARSVAEVILPLLGVGVQ